mgnify:CR=1 FL=1
MALTDSEVTAAKAEAKKYLEYSIQILSVSLGVDSATVSSSYTIPVASDHGDYASYESMKNQATALEALG